MRDPFLLGPLSSVYLAPFNSISLSDTVNSDRIRTGCRVFFGSITSRRYRFLSPAAAVLIDSRTTHLRFPIVLLRQSRILAHMCRLRFCQNSVSGQNNIIPHLLRRPCPCPAHTAYLRPFRRENVEPRLGIELSIAGTAISVSMNDRAHSSTIFSFRTI